MAGSGSQASEPSVFVSRCSSFPPDPLELKPDRQFATVEVEVVPRESEDLATPEAERQVT